MGPETPFFAVTSANEHNLRQSYQAHDIFRRQEKDDDRGQQAKQLKVMDKDLAKSHIAADRGPKKIQTLQWTN